MSVPRPVSTDRIDPDPHRVKRVLRAMARDALGEDCAADAVALPRHAPSPRDAAFQGGRACALAALNALGAKPSSIPRDASGVPVWPAGFVGSISHTDRLAAAIAARSPPADGVGLDIDSTDPLEDANMVALIGRPEELLPGAALSRLANRERGKRLFVAKESVYKLYWPLARTFLDFHDVRVTLDDAGGGFVAELVNPRKPGIEGSRGVSGSMARCDDLLIAFAFRCLP